MENNNINLPDFNNVELEESGYVREQSLSKSETKDKDNFISMLDAESSLNEETSKIAQNIVKEKDIDKVKDMTHLFELNQSKKNMLRILKLNGLLDKVSDEALNRVTNCPGEMDNLELLNYMKTTQDTLKASQDYIKDINTNPSLQLNANQQNNIQVNIGGEESNLSKDSRDKILDLIGDILKNVKETSKNETNVVDADIIKKNGENINNGKENK